jgi:hypothetical protein
VVRCACTRTVGTRLLRRFSPFIHLPVLRGGSTPRGWWRSVFASAGAGRESDRSAVLCTRCRGALGTGGEDLRIRSRWTLDIHPQLPHGRPRSSCLVHARVAARMRLGVVSWYLLVVRPGPLCTARAGRCSSDAWRGLLCLARARTRRSAGPPSCFRCRPAQASSSTSTSASQDKAQR